MKRLRSFPRFAVAAALCVTAAGCGPAYDVVPVSGRVTWDGQPAANVGVLFQPVSEEPGDPGPGSFGTTDAEGRFTLRLVEPDRPGAVVGRHRVRITPPAQQEYDPMDDLGAPGNLRLPPHFLDGSIEVTIPPGGTDQADIELQTVPTP